jgi:hypothetical protein
MLTAATQSPQHAQQHAFRPYDYLDCLRDADLDLNRRHTADVTVRGVTNRANLRLLCVTWVMLSGCGNEPQVTPDTFALERAQALCAQRAACCHSEADADFDEQACARSEADEYRHWMASLRADFAADAADGCLAAYRTGCSELDGAVQQACARVWRGRQPVDADCEVDAECAPTQGLLTRCRVVVQDDFDRMLSRTHARCMPDEHARENFVRAEAGQACKGQCNAGPEGRCTGQVGQESPTHACFEADGLICIEGHCESLPGAQAECVLGRCDSRVSYCDEANQCREHEPEGATCRHAGECAQGSYCASETSHCTQLLALGEACEDAAQCASGVCAETCVDARPLLCEQASQTAE